MIASQRVKLLGNNNDNNNHDGDDDNNHHTYISIGQKEAQRRIDSLQAIEGRWEGERVLIIICWVL